jgi:acetyl/propionyl-CoA carboxylase alpha subunit
VIGPSFPFRVVLVANRGEIAVRIIRTLQKLGLQSAVVYHEVDARSPAVALADHAIRISGRTPLSSYLDGDQIIAAALSVAAGAIHPGYGFLSENAVFARAVEAAGLLANSKRFAAVQVSEFCTIMRLTAMSSCR